MLRRRKGVVPACETLNRVGLDSAELGSPKFFVGSKRLEPPALSKTQELPAKSIPARVAQQNGPKY